MFNRHIADKLERMKFLRLYKKDEDNKLLYFVDINDNDKEYVLSAGIIKGKRTIGAKQKTLMTRADIGIVYNCKVAGNFNYAGIPIIESMRKFPD